jgi:hypothetical protein
MMSKVKNAKDFWAGLMFIAFGLAFMLVSKNYAMGSAVRMGPAYFPTVLGGIQLALGLIIFVRAFLSKVENGAVNKLHLKPLFIILGAVVLFAVLLKPAGLIIAIFALIMVSAFGGNDFRFKEILLVTIVLVIGSVAVFYYGLGLPFNLWPELGN